MSIRVGVIGAGHLGSLHAKMYARSGSAQLAGIFDVDAARAARVAQEFGTRATASLPELLDLVDAVSVATTTRSHFDVAREAILRGVHVLVEKPITETIEQARELIRLADEHSVKIQVGHIERFNPAIVALEAYELAPLFIESHRLAQFNPRGSDVAVVLDLMIHDIDLILSLVRSGVRRIDASGVAVVSSSVDIANARLQFENGCVANVTASRISQNRMRKMRLFQRDAYISIDFQQGGAEVFRLVDERANNAKPTMLLGSIDQGERKRMIVYERPEIPEINALEHELGLFLRAVERGTEPPVTGRDGLQALEVAQEILKNIEAHQARLSASWNAT